MQDVQRIAERYTAAWCNHDPGQVAAFFALGGTLIINSGEPAIGRPAIARIAAGFMTAFPDLEVLMDALESAGEHTIYRRTLAGTFGATGNRVRISGYEDWLIDEDGMIVVARGHFDANDYARQILQGPNGNG